MVSLLVTIPLIKSVANSYSTEHPFDVGPCTKQTTRYSFGVLFKALLDDPTMRESGSSGTASIGVISTSLMLGFSMFTGPLVRKHGARTISACGTVLVACGLFLASFAPSVTVLYVTYGAIAGVGFSMLWAPCVMVRDPCAHATINLLSLCVRIAS